MVASFEENEDQPLAEQLMRAIEAGDTTGSELEQVATPPLSLSCTRKSYRSSTCGSISIPNRSSELRFLWELYQPTANSCVVRAVDPDKAQGAA